MPRGSKKRSRSKNLRSAKSSINSICQSATTWMEGGDTNVVRPKGLLTWPASRAERRTDRVSMMRLADSPVSRRLNDDAIDRRRLESARRGAQIGKKRICIE